MLEKLQSRQVGGVLPLTKITPQESNHRELSDPEDTLDNNVLSDLVSDEIYYALQEHGLFDEKAIRDYHIRKSFKEFRKTMNTTFAIEKLQQLYPYLQFDTLRKIVYRVGNRKKK